MADAAEVLPLPEEEPANEAPQSDDSAAADDSGKDVSFGTFLTVGPKETRNVTIVGFDALRNTVRAVRRSGDTVENIQIPYEQYKTIIEEQKESDKATGRRTKKNLSKAVRGYFGKSVSLDGKPTQVIGYDAQSDEVLVNDGASRRWIKSGEMLRSMVVQRALPSSQAAEDDKKLEFEKAAKKLQKELQKIDPNLRVEVEKVSYRNSDGSSKRNAHALKISHKDNPNIRWSMTWTDKSYPETKLLNDARRVYEEVRTGAPVQIRTGTSDARIKQYQDVKEQSDEILKLIDPEMRTEIQRTNLNYLDGSIGENVVVLTFIHPTNPGLSWNLELKPGEQMSDAQLEKVIVKSRQEQYSPSIRETRAELKVVRSAAGGAPVQAAIAAVATVAAAIPAASNAAPVIAAVQSALAAYGASAATRQTQMQQLSGQISETSDRINALQQRSRQAKAGGDTAQSVQFEQQISQLQTSRSALQNQQTDIQVRGINEDNKASQIVEAVQQLEPDANGIVPESQVAEVQKLLPTLAVNPVLESANAAAAAALPRPKPVAPSRSFAAGIPSRRTSATPSPSVRTPKPIRPLGGSLSSIGGQAQRAVELGADQAYDRGAEADNSRLSDSSEQAFATEGGLPGYRGPLDSPQAKAQTYMAGADTEPEKADIYGAQEEEASARQAAMNQGVQEELPPGNELTPQGEGQSSMVETEGAPEQPQGQLPAGPSPQEIARADALQQGTSQSVLQQSKQEQAKEKAGAQGASAEADAKKKQIESAKKAISNLVDLFDAAHGFTDVVGLLMTFGHLNLRLALTPFGRDLPFVPRAGFPYECGAIGCFDALLCVSAFMYLATPVIILGAIFTTLGGTGLVLADLFGILSP